MNWLTSHHVDIGSSHVTYAGLLVALACIVVGFLVASRLVARLRGVPGAGPTPKWRTTLAPFVGFALRFASIALAFQISGVDVGSILAAGAVVAVGIGIAMQKVAENFVSGIILMAERSIREDDIIEFEGRVARVRQIGIRATIAQTLDDEEIIVPNSILTQLAVKNLTLTEPILRLRVKVGVAYGTDLDVADAALRKAADEVEWRATEHDPIVLLLEFGPSSVDFEVSVWTRDAWALRRDQSRLRKAVWRALRDASISIPFPQLDVHLVEPASPVRASG